MAHFDDTSGVVSCNTDWGRWWQTMEDVCIEVNLEEGTTARLVQCQIKPKTIKVVVKGNPVIEGDFTESVQADDSIWTLEDRKLLRMYLPKALSGADKCWKSLLKGQYVADPFTYDQMEQKLNLQRFQYEDRKLLRICLPKALSGADKCWKSLLKGQYVVDPFTYDQMEQKLTLQRFQYENPGMDFSGAEITGNYQKGGPQLPER